MRLLAYLLLRLGNRTGLAVCDTTCDVSCAALQDEVTGKDYWIVKNSW